MKNDKEKAGGGAGRDLFSIPGEIAGQYRKEAQRLGCDHKALYRAALRQLAGQFPLKKELVLA
jgi:hypothetical protein